MERKLSPEEQEKFRLLSDGKLYQDAIDFAGRTPPIEKSQMAGLLEYSHAWEALETFVKHQKDDRDWGEPGRSNRAHYQEFYNELSAYLSDLYDDVQQKYGFVFPEGLTKNEKKDQIDFFAGLLAQEFIQHLAAEMMWQAWRQGG
jgi:hypothetical protein